MTVGCVVSEDGTQAARSAKGQVESGSADVQGPQHVPEPDLGGGAGGPGTRPPTIEGPFTKLLIFYFLLMNRLMTSL